MYLQIRKIVEAIRLHDWWHFIIPPIIGFFFLGIQYSKVPYDIYQLILGVCKLLFLAAPVAAFGFFINEWTDIHEDAIAKKRNYVSEIPRGWRLIIFTSISIGLILAVFIIDFSFTIRCLVGIQILLLVSYSAPYIRLKERPAFAIILDALYSGTLFYIIALLMSCNVHEWQLICGFAFGMMKGFRNIIFHLMEDRDNDIMAGRKTIAQIISESNIINWQQILWLLEVMMILPLCFYAGIITFAIFLTGFILILIKRHFYVSNRPYSEKETHKWLGELNTLYELWFLAGTLTGVMVILSWKLLIFSWLFMFLIFPHTRKIFNELYIGLYNLFYFISDLYFIYTKPHFDIGKILRRIFK